MPLSPAPSAPTQRLTGLRPVVSDATVLLVLGSFPGAASLAAQQYYGHPQNHFWRILEAIWPPSQRQMVTDSYENRIAWLLDHGLGLWDVYASCERQGSLDTAIRHAEVNDFAALARALPVAARHRTQWRGELQACAAHGHPRCGGAPAAVDQPGQCLLELRAQARRVARRV
jgi:hypoxanthine-DNA glycosylase